MVMRGSTTCASRKKGDDIRLSYTFHYPGIVNQARIPGTPYPPGYQVISQNLNWRQNNL